MIEFDQWLEMSLRELKEKELLEKELKERLLHLVQLKGTRSEPKKGYILSELMLGLMWDKSKKGTRATSSKLVSE